MDLIEQLESDTDETLGLKTGYRELRIAIELLRGHLTGSLVTSTALALASGLSYGTAMRALQNMEERGLIVKRPRTYTGKSYSLHPSAVLLTRWEEYARRIRALIYMARLENQALDAVEKAKFDAPSAARILPVPSVLKEKLHLGKCIRFLVHADPTFSAMNALKKRFEMMFGVEIRSRALSIDRLHAEIIANSSLQTSRYDIIACDLPWFGEMASMGRLMPLDSIFDRTDFDKQDFHPDALASVRHKGAHYGVPILTTAEILVYRTDLYAAEGLSPPNTVSACLANAKVLHNPKKGISGIAWTGGRGTPVGHTFIMVMSAFGQPIVNLRRLDDGFDAEHVSGDELRPMFLAEAAHETANYLRELLDYSAPNTLNMTWYDRAMAYAQGSAASAYSHSLLASLFERNEASPAYRRTGYAPHPAGPRGQAVAPLGGYALAIPSNIEEGRAAPVRIALQALTSASAAKLYLANGSLSSPRFSVSRDPDIRSASPMIPAIDEMARTGVMRVWPRPPVPEWSDLVAIAGEEIHDMLGKRKSVSQALTGAQNRADALMRTRGHY